jgi:serine/threonine protein kinase
MPGTRTESVESTERVRTETGEYGALPVDREEAVSRRAVDSQLISPEQGRAALLVSRLTKAPVSEVLRENRLADERTVHAIEEDVDEHLVPGYRIVGRLGRGSQGIVYKAVQKCLERVVALKVVSLRGAGTGSLQRRMEREARAIARLNHQNIVAAYDYGQSRGRLFLAMEFVEGTSCEKELARRRGPLVKARALGIARGVASGLQYAQEAGIIHRDIKPANLMLPLRAAGDFGTTPLPSVKVADLGLSRVGRSDLTIEGTILGTPGYMAPEQARGEVVDHRADIYSLGATLYHMVTGRRPFAGAESYTVLLRQATERIPDPRDLNPELHAGVAFLLQAMMSRNPETRYQDYGDLIEDVDRVSSGRKPLHPMPPLRDRSIRGPSQGVPPEMPSSVDLGSRILVLDRTPDGVSRLIREGEGKEGPDRRCA